MSEAAPEEHRPFPDPEHSITPRKPRTPGGLVYLAVLAVTIAGIVVVVLGQWQAGLTVMGIGLLGGAVARLLIPDDLAGMLGIRRKLFDVATLVALGSGLVVIALVIPNRSGLG